MLVFRQVHKAYATPQGPLTVLAGVDLVLAPGESLALMGESGSGKSTLLHLAAGLDLPDAGEVSLAPRPALLLADEPTGNLDETTAGEVLELLLALVRDTGGALLVVTHSPRVAAPLDRCLRLSRGRLADDRSPEPLA